MEKKVLFLWFALALCFIEVQFSLFSRALINQSADSSTPLISVISIIILKAVIVVVLLFFMIRFWILWYKQEPMPSLRYYVVACFVFFPLIAGYFFGAGFFVFSVFSLIFIWHHFKTTKAVVVIALYGLVSNAIITFVFNSFRANYLIFFGNALFKLFFFLLLVFAFFAGFASTLAIFLRAKLTDLKDLFLHDLGLVFLMLLPYLVILGLIHVISSL